MKTLLGRFRSTSAGAAWLVTFTCASAAAAGQQGGGTYHFDEGSGAVALDSSGAGNHGWIDGPSFVAPGRGGTGYALRFRPGSLDRVSLPPSLFDGFGNTVFVEAWVRVTSYPVGAGCVHTALEKRSPYNDFFLGVGENGALSATLYGTRTDGILGAAGGVWGAGSIPLNTWTKIACSYDGATLRGFVNDSLVGSATLPLTPDWSGIRTEIGNDSYDAGINCGDYGINGDVDDVVVAKSGALLVPIDIREGAVNPRSHGVLPVAVLSTDGFDVAALEPGTIRFGVTGVEAAPVRSSLEDVDGDGRRDLVLHFTTALTGIRCGDTVAELRGRTTSGLEVLGRDTFRTSGCK